MKYVLFSIISLLLPIVALASEKADRGDRAYQAEQYSEAIALYLEAMKEDGTSADLYYNLGNAYYRKGEIDKAILSYERALRLEPSHSEARANLAFVNDRIVDKKGESGSFLSNTFASTVNLMSSNGWAYLALALFLLTIAGVLTYIYFDAILVRKIGFFGSILTAIFFLITIFFAFEAKGMSEDTSEAIITKETSILSTVPRAPMTREEEALLLHKGTKVKILRSMSMPSDSATQVWNEVSVDNNHRAWINDEDITRIVEN